MKSLIAAAFAVALLTPALAQAHCDTLDGPVVVAARRALESGKSAPVLVWTQPKDAKEVEAALKKARLESKKPEAKAAAETAFFETVVRLHRAGEKAEYTGLKPAGTTEPAVLAADRAIAGGSLAEVEKLIGPHADHAKLKALFAALKGLKAPPEDRVEKGREWVAAYVPFVHFVEESASGHTCGGGAKHE